MKISHNYYIIF